MDDQRHPLDPKRAAWRRFLPVVLFSLIAHLIASGGYDPQLGARPMRRTIERLVEGPISELILTGSVDAGGEVVITVADGKVVVSPRS